MSFSVCRSPSHNSLMGGSGWNNSSATESPSSTNYEARVEDGKLFYEKRWYGVALAVLGSWNKLDRIGKKLEVTSS